MIYGYEADIFKDEEVLHKSIIERNKNGFKVGEYAYMNYMNYYSLFCKIEKVIIEKNKRLYDVSLYNRKDEKFVLRTPFDKWYRANETELLKIDQAIVMSLLI